jgi:hypothetical protein
MSKAAIILAAGAPGAFFRVASIRSCGSVSRRKNATKKLKGARDE